MGYKVAVVGATCYVGRVILNTLHEREFPVDEIYALASQRSVGREVSFGDKDVK
ncbi:MAG: aspartate-semialdehyde dehydrogenase, partial [Pseudomonadota bacterium]|nr:aspartate-semialdehyde dehydrogenase [Pseudomonadota bacterium]